jgi:hypothetical protein
MKQGAEESIYLGEINGIWAKSPKSTTTHCSSEEEVPS